MKLKSEDPSSLSYILRGKEMDERNHAKPAHISLAGFVFISLFLAYAMPTFAEVGISISGVVHDTSGVPLSRVNIRLSDTPIGATTDPSGRFYFRDLPAGTYQIQASHLGYFSGFSNSIIVREGAPAQVEISLKPQPITLPEATVRSTGTKLSANNEIVILAREWSADGAKSVGDALRDIQGVDVREGAMGTKISLRGSPPRAVKIKWNGVPLNDAGTGEADLSGISLNDLSSIRVKFRGYGGDIDLATRAPSSENKPVNVTLNGKTGGNELGGGGARIDASGNLWAGSAGGSQEFSRGDFTYVLDDGIEKTRINNQSRLRSINGELNHSLSSMKVRANVLYSDIQRGAPGLIYAAPTPEATLYNRRLIASLFADGSRDKYHWTAQAYFNRNINRYDSPAQQYSPATGKIVNHIAESSQHSGWRTGLNASITSSSETIFGNPISSATTLSGNLQRDLFRGEDLLRGTTLVGGIGLGDARRDVASLMAQSTLRTDWGNWNAQFTPSASTNYIGNSGKRDFIFTPSSVSGSITHAGKKIDLTMFSSWGRNLNAPPFNAQFLVESVYAVGNPDLKPEQGETWRVGMESVLRISRSTFARLSTSWFNSRVEDLIIWQRNSAGKYYPDNLTQAQSTGWENSLILNSSDWFSWSLNIKVEDARLDIPGDINDGNIPPMTARESGNSRVKFHFQPVEVSIASRWAGKRFSTASNMDDISTAGMDLSPYTVWDTYLSVAFEISRISGNIGIGLDNIFDRSYRIVERSPMPGRIYSVNLTVNV